VAAVTLTGGLGIAATSVASAATPDCGTSCTNLFTGLYGPGFVPGVVGQGQNAGQPIILAPASSGNPGEDFQAVADGLVRDFIAVGIVSPGLSAYNDKTVFEFKYTPKGAFTGLCMGVGAVPGNNTPVALQFCGVSAKTVWIWNSDQPLTGGADASLINGATDTSFSHPYTLTDLKPGGSRQLFTWPLGTGGIIQNKSANQLWAASVGALPSS
jgi:hypothetical protein